MKIFFYSFCMKVSEVSGDVNVNKRAFCIIMKLVSVYFHLVCPSLVLMIMGYACRGNLFIQHEGYSPRVCFLFILFFFSFNELISFLVLCVLKGVLYCSLSLSLLLFFFLLLFLTHFLYQ